MNPTNFLHERNRFVLTLFICSFAIVTFLFCSPTKISIEHFPLLPFFAVIWSLYSSFMLKNTKFVMASNLLLMSLSVFLHTLPDVNMIHVSWLVFICFLATLYYSLKTTLIALTITLLQCIVLYTISPATLLEPSLLMNMLFLAVCIIVCQAWNSHLFNSSYFAMTEQAKQNYYLHMFFEQANDAIAVVDLDNHIIDMNPAFEKLYGWNRDTCIGQELFLVPEENRLAADERVARLKTGESIPAFETVDLRRDGTPIHVQLSMSPIFNDDNDMIAISIISQDITYKKNAERRILQSEKLALAGEIAAGVAHEIRNPLTAVSGFIQMMNEDKESPYYTYTQIIQSELARINLIIGEFLVLSKPHIDDVKRLSITDVCLTIATFLQFEFQSKDIHFEQHIPAEDYYILADENQIKQVLLNILRNSIEAVSQQGVINLRLLATTADSITIELCDNGIGMAEDTLDQVFEPFFTTKESGTGLGMVLTNKIIRSFGGDIHIESELNVGTKIAITFPTVP